MLKSSKFRQAPVRYFRDSKHPWLRKMGTPVGEWVERQPLLLELLESPHDMLERRSHSPWAWPVRRMLDAQAAQRRRVIQAHGTPLVSVIMPARNAAGTIAASIESLLRQTHEALEIIVIDDRSDDGTRAVVQRFADTSPAVQLAVNPGPGGAARARNVGLRLCRGEFITFLDADDTSHPERVERQLAALLETPNATVSTCNYRRQQPSGAVVIVNDYRFQRSIISMMFHRSHLERLGGMNDLIVGEDADFFERLLEGRKGSVVHIQKTMYLANYDRNSLLFSNSEATVRTAE